jgi:hypothetical protein
VAGRSESRSLTTRPIATALIDLSAAVPCLLAGLERSRLQRDQNNGWSGNRGAKRGARGYLRWDDTALVITSDQLCGGVTLSSAAENEARIPVMLAARSNVASNLDELIGEFPNGCVEKKSPARSPSSPPAVYRPQSSSGVLQKVQCERVNFTRPRGARIAIYLRCVA